MSVHRLAPVAGALLLVLLTGCDEISAIAASDGDSAKAEATTFGRRATAQQRLDSQGVDLAFMVEAPETGLDLGWGWSVGRGQAIPTVCVEFERQSDPAQETTVQVDEVRDSQELTSSMDISSSVSVKTIGYKASGKAKFAKDTKVSSYSMTMVIEAEVRNGALFAAPKANARGQLGDAVVLTDKAANLARRDLEAFQATCGEGYVSAVMTGAEAFAVIDIKTSSRSETESVRASVSGAGWGVKVDAAFNAATGSQQQSAKSSISFYQAGGSGKPLPADKDEIIQRIKDLAVDAKDSPKAYALEITPYQTLVNFPRGETLTGDPGETDEIAAAWGLYRTVYDDIGAVFATPAKFELPVATCSNAGTPADCTVTFQPLAATDLGAGLSTLDMLGALQDIALFALDRVELGAQACLADDRECGLDSAGLRSAYAVRAGLPLPAGWLADAGADDAVKLAAHLGFHLRDAARGRCAISSLAIGCISNAEIAGWAARTGFVPLAAPDKASFQRATAALQDVTPFLTGDPDRPTALTLWVPHDQVVTARAAITGGSFKTVSK